MTRRKPFRWDVALKNLFSPSRRRRSQAVRLQAERLDDRIAPAVVFTVNTTMDDLSYNPVTREGSLRGVILAANASSFTDVTIRIPAGVYTLTRSNLSPTFQQENAGLYGDLDIIDLGNVPTLKTYRFVGVGGTATIRQTVPDRVFQIFSDNLNDVAVIFENLRIEGGRARDNGQAVAPFTTDSWGGAILMSGNNVGGGAAHLTFINTTLQNNRAEGQNGSNGVNGANGANGANGTGDSPNGSPGTPGTDGAPGTNGTSAYGGAIYSVGGTITLVATTITTNQARGGNGGRGGSGGNGGNGGAGAAPSASPDPGGDGGAGAYGGAGADGGHGGDAFGGGIYAVNVDITLTSASSVRGNQVIAGNGGDGGNGGNGGNGGAGGNGNGSTLAARGGDGGFGGAGRRGGHGGHGGDAGGGGVHVVNGNVTLTGGSSIRENTLTAGNGGRGGNSGSGGAGGNGGNSPVDSNTNPYARWGYGGRGGHAPHNQSDSFLPIGQTMGQAGAGGSGGSARGGGLYVGLGTVTLSQTSSVTLNQLQVGNGGDGGVGGNGGNAGAFGTGRTIGPPLGQDRIGGRGGHAGAGGAAGEGLGAGVYAAHGNVILLTRSTVVQNQFAQNRRAGHGGNGGNAGVGAGGPGQNEGGYGGHGGDASFAIGGGIYAAFGDVTIDNTSIVGTNAVYGAAGGNGGRGGAGPISFAQPRGNDGQEGAGAAALGGGLFAASGAVLVDNNSAVRNNIAAGGNGGNDGNDGTSSRSSRFDPTFPNNFANPNSALQARVSGRSVYLTWSPSTDDVQIAGYRVFQGATQIGQTGPNVTHFTVTGLSSGTYTYSVRAVDNDGNVSSLSNTVNVTIGTVADTTPPTVPLNLQAKAASGDAVLLGWSPSTDSVGIAGYIVWGRQGTSGPFVQYGTVTRLQYDGTSFVVTGLSPRQNYQFYVQAVDLAGNASVNSATVTVTTRNQGGAALGGGVHVLDGSFTLRNGASVTSNQAGAGNSGTEPGSDRGGEAWGGGVFVGTGPVIVGGTTGTGVVVSQNQAQAGNSISKFGGSSKGGGIYLGSGSMTLTNATFEQNSVRGGNGVAIGPDGGEAAGGAVYLGSGPVTVTASKLSGNQVRGGDAVADTGGDARGGAISADNGAVTIRQGSLVTQNTVRGGDVGITNDRGGDAFGGGVYVAGGDFTLQSSTISKNKVTGGNGGKGIEPIPFVLPADSNRDGGRGGDARGGGVYAQNVGFTVTIERTGAVNALVNSNAVLGGNGGNGVNFPGAGRGGDGGRAGHAQGGGLWVNGGTVVLSDLSVSNNGAAAGLAGLGGGGARENPAPRGGTGGAGGDALGAGIYGNSANFTLTNVEITGNSGTAGNGGRGGAGGQNPSPFQNNGIGGDGGVGGRGAGGGLYVQSGNVTMTASQVIDNRIAGGDGGSGGTGGTWGELGVPHGLNGQAGAGGRGGNLEGGGLYVGSGSLTITRVNVSGNQLGGTGVSRADGGIGGSAPRGVGGTGGRGGDVLGAGIFSGSGNVTIRDSSITRNGVPLTFPIGGNGGRGGVADPNGPLNLFGNPRGGPGQAGNSFGGGLYSAGGNVLVANSTISRNYAGAGGNSGSFGIGGDGSFNGTGQGGGVYVLAGTTTIQNTTIVENQSRDQGGGVRHAATGSFDLLSTLVGQNNTIPGFNTAVTGRDLSINSAASVTANNNLIETSSGHTISGGTNTVGLAFVSGGVNTVYGPLTFHAPSGTDYHPLLTTATAALNNGFNPVGRTADQIGNLVSPPHIGAVNVVTLPGGGDTTPPTVPTLSVINPTMTTLTLQWTASTDDVALDRYEIVYRQGTTGPFQPLATVGPATTTYIVTGLLSDTIYQFRVRAVDTSGNESAYSNTAQGQTLPDTQPPTAPTNLSVSNITSTSMDLSWFPSSDNVGVTGYRVFGRPVSTSLFTLLGTTGGTTTTFTVTGLLPGTTYQFYVVAVDAAGNVSSASNSVTETTATPAGDTTPPTAPLNLTASGLTSSSVTLTWDPSTDTGTGVAGYIVYGTIGTNPTIVQFGQTVGASSTTIVLTGLTPGTTYQFYVVAQDGAGNLSGPSNTVSVTTPLGGDTTPPTAPTALTVTGVTSTSVALSWGASTDAQSGISGYLIFFRQGTSGPFAQFGSVTTTSGIVTGLTPNTLYEFFVVAVDGAGNPSSPSNVVQATTPPAGTDTTPPSIPLSLTASGVTATGVTLSWTASSDPESGISGYVVFGRAGTSGPFTQFGTTSGPTTLTLTGLTPNTTYQFYVVAVNGVGLQSDPSNTVAVTTAAAGPLPATQPVVVATGNGLIRLVNPAGSTPTVLLTLQPFPGYTGLVRVALGDVNNDGTPDIIAATAGAHKGQVRVYDGAAAQLGSAVMLARFRAFKNYTGGLSVAAADVNNDGFADIVVGTGRGTVARVAVVSGQNLPPMLPGNAFQVPAYLGSVLRPFGPGYQGGVHVAAANVTGDARAEVLVSRAAGRSDIRGYTRTPAGWQQTVTMLSPFGNRPAQLATLDADGNGLADIATGTRLPDGRVQVRVYNGTGQNLSTFTTPLSGVAFGLGSLATAGPTQDLLVGIQPSPSSVLTINDVQILVLNPLSGLRVGGFNAFAALAGGVALSSGV